MRICLVIPGGLDPRREDHRIPVLQWFVESLSRRHSVEVFALRQSHETATFEFAGATVHAVAGRSFWGVLRIMLRAHYRAPFDVVQAFWASRPGLVGVVAGFFMRRPAFVHVAGGELVAMPDIAYGTLRSRKGRAMVRTVVRRATEVTVASGGMMEAVARWGRTPRCVPLGVDLQRWPAVRPPPLVEAPYRLIHVASLNKVKNQRTLLQTMARLGSTDFPFRLDIVGVDTLDGEVHQLAARLKLTDHVTFHGWLPQSAVRDLMCQAHLHLLTSLHEAGPLVVREAAACGVVTLGTHVGHVADWAPDGAVVVDANDGVGMANEIRQLLRNDSRRVELANAAQAKSVQHDIEWTSSQFEAMYREYVSK